MHGEQLKPRGLSSALQRIPSNTRLPGGEAGGWDEQGPAGSGRGSWSGFGPDDCDLSTPAFGWKQGNGSADVSIPTLPGERG